MMTTRRYKYDPETDEMVEIPISAGAGTALPACRTRSYDGIKVWSQAPWKGPGPDPRGFEHHDAVGHPIITSRAQIDEVQGRTAHTDQPLIWSREH